MKEVMKGMYLTLGIATFLVACQPTSKPSSEESSVIDTTAVRAFKSEPLVTHIYTADPSAHVFEGKLYIYPSHDWESGIAEDDFGSHFDMQDYHILSMDEVGGEVTDHGVALDKKDIAWAGRQLWAPDAAEKDGTYYLYFPLKDKQDIFKIGVATSDRPEGPFTAEPEPMKNSYSMDPAVFKDDDGAYYMYFGGVWGGQLQRWDDNTYDASVTAQEPSGDVPALLPRVAKLSDDMKQFAEEVKEVEILDADGSPIMADDHDKRFFEASWVHKYNDKYYFSYSTGDTHNICYATGDNPYGPFTYQGIILEPVYGWTNHHSITEFNGKWYLFYHDTSLSEGQTHLRSVKMMELKHDENGKIETLSAFKE
ncbi:Glycosyl hydrolases family 43 [Reichenbachiella agariperforans]|uniref:Glycosyl hydrolases family 43 n=1 Tax=Reichenbachiella agariperforans TaxID=156994 RepID=A0A1M6PTY1_REIAG|nr:glycoside hydrolase family 43 protein [Reichenbachiella agariperforans]SHK11407.1 Glycosyl hydrolases family 43 [Reichenbachiella agariperforans]